jgi:hypothetical protein
MRPAEKDDAVVSVLRHTKRSSPFRTTDSDNDLAFVAHVAAGEQGTHCPSLTFRTPRGDSAL